MVSYSWWKRALARDPSVLSKKLKIGSTVFTIVGVAPQEFFGTKVGESPDIWIPLSMQREVPPNFDGYSQNFSESLYLIRDVDRNLPISNVSTLDEQVGRSITNQKLVAQLSAFFGLLAAFLSCIGIYGVMSYVVSRRTNEIGVRMALGSGRFNVLWVVLRESLILVTTGIAIGIPVALAGSRLLSSMLFGVSTTDPVTMASASVLLLTFAAIAGYLPARRASLIDPMVALRYK